MRVVSRFDFLAGETSVNLSRAPNDTVMASMPNADAVDAYLCYHALEAVVDEAVNDAVLKQVTVRRTRCHSVNNSWRSWPLHVHAHEHVHVCVRRTRTPTSRCCS